MRRLVAATAVALMALSVLIVPAGAQSPPPFSCVQIKDEPRHKLVRTSDNRVLLTASSLSNCQRFLPGRNRSITTARETYYQALEGVNKQTGRSDWRKEHFDQIADQITDNLGDTGAMCTYGEGSREITKHGNGKDRNDGGTDNGNWVEYGPWSSGGWQSEPVPC